MIQTKCTDVIEQSSMFWGACFQTYY